MVSLKDALKSLNTPKPVDFDPEDFERKNPDSDVGSDDENLTAFERKERDQERKLARAHYVDVGRSALRRQNDKDIEIDGKQYKGAKVSRKDLYKEESEDDEESDDGDEEELEGEEEQLESVSDYESEDEESGSDEESASDGEDDDVDTEEVIKNSSKLDDKKRNQLKELLRTEQQKLVSQISKAAKDEAKKGEGIKNQIKVYETILDSRIKIQKGLAASNSLPLTQKSAKKYTTKATPKLLKAVASDLFELLDDIATIRENMLIKDSIISESDVSIKSGKRDLQTAFGNEQALSKKLKPYSDAVLTKWSKKVQAASGVSALNASKFSIKNTNAQVQVASHLADMDRLINRTRINRSQAKILGEGDAEAEGDEEGKEEDDEELDEKERIKRRIAEQKKQKKLKQQQILLQKQKKQQEDEPAASTDLELKEREEIYDDTDFYRALLKDLVDRRMADSSVASSVKWTITKSNANGKDTKSEDKFSKDRKLKYTVQEKIQNFDAPRNTIRWSDEQIDELFSGLFGQKIEVNENEAEDESEEEQGEDDYIVNDGLKIFG